MLIYVNKISPMIYEKILRPLLFLFTDPESIHRWVIKALGIVSRQKPLYNLLHNFLSSTDPRLATRLGSLELKNPVGLAAGFDKYLEAPRAYPMLGFGFAELGSITYSEQAGNPRPRLWRLPKDKGLIIFYGLANAGAKKTAELFSQIKGHPTPYGISLAPTNGLKVEKMVEDYVKSLLELHQYADYITLNVGCPNVASCTTFTQIYFIEELLGAVDKTLKDHHIKKDVFIKIGPDYTRDELSQIIAICLAHHITGVIATNLIKNRDAIKFKSSAVELSHPGGISGLTLQRQSDTIIKQLYQESQGRLKIIGVGGIFTAEDAYRKIRLGASAVQIITGFIYGGPFIVKKINDGLIKLLERDGYKNIAEAVGKDAPVASGEPT